MNTNRSNQPAPLSLDRILNLTPTEHRDALCFLAGFMPEAVTAALDEMDQQRKHYAAFRARQIVEAQWREL